jgi:hypothetical protein
VSAIDIEFCRAPVNQNSLEFTKQFWWEQVLNACQEFIMILMHAKMVAAEMPVNCS